jgi:sulfatase modifying factor 1
VTVGRFRQFVSAWNNGAGYTPPAGSGKHTHVNGGQGLANSGGSGTYETGWATADNSNIAPTTANLTSNCSSAYATWTSAPGPENLPINCLNWYEAYAFCIWDGGFLPSEAEWEYAAAGGNQQREYPWGTAAPGTSSVYAIYGCYYPSGSGTCSGVTNIAPVGVATAGAGLWGQLDLAGNQEQWVVDWYANYANPCSDCAYMTAASGVPIRGGSYGFDVSALVPPYRSEYPKTGRNSGVGVRCARIP